MTNPPTRPHPRLARLLVALAVAAIALGATACGSDKKNDSAGTGGNGTTGTEITIKDFEFSPDPLKAGAGATITVKNDDSTAHTVTADDDSFDTGDIAAGGTDTITLPDKAGKVAYHCNIHNSMKGTIEVTA
jgi:plastocyanin